MRLTEEINYAGYFWLPDEPDKKIPGHLRIEDGGSISLEVVGLFGGEESYFKEADNLERIIGNVEKLGFITLDKCFYTQKNFSFGGISKSRVCVNYAYAGVAYDCGEVPLFDGLTFEVDGLSEWVGITGVAVSTNLDSKTTTITCNPVESLAYTLADDLQLRIIFGYTLPVTRGKPETIVKENVYFQLLSTKPMEVEKITSVVHKISSFVGFAIGKTVSLKNLIATSKEIKYEIDEGNFRQVQIQLFYQSIPFTEHAPKVNRTEMLFNFGTIRERANDFFGNWLNSYEMLSPSLNLYFSVKNGGHKHLEPRFLALAQGLETFHRRTSTEVLMEQRIFETLISKIMEGCPEAHSDWLKGRLEHGNEINLRKRLERLVEPYKDIFGSGTARRSLINKIVNTRNYLTHYSKDMKSKAASGIEIYPLCSKMEALFQLHFLSMIGFNREEISAIVQNCRPLKHSLEGGAT